MAKTFTPRKECACVCSLSTHVCIREPFMVSTWKTRLMNLSMRCHWARPRKVGKHFRFPLNFDVVLVGNLIIAFESLSRTKQLKTLLQLASSVDELNKKFRNRLRTTICIWILHNLFRELICGELKGSEALLRNFFASQFYGALE